MKYEMYSQYEFTYDFSVIDFISIGKNGAIPKRIIFKRTELANVYNLAFGDIDENDEIDDYSISDNGDRNKILATVFHVVDVYTKKYPERLILFSGSTSERTRLYRMAVSINLEEVSKDFEIYAYVDEELKLFTKGMEINAFVIKILNFMYMKKVYKYKSTLFNQEVELTFTYNPELDKLKDRVLAPRKLEEANKMLRKLKTPLPK